MNNGECQVMIVAIPRGVTQGCRLCGTILARGEFLIGLQIDEDEKSFHYFLGDPQEHCGEPKKVLKSFATEAEAKIVKRQVMSLITEKGTTEGLPLIELCDTGLN